MQVKENQVTLIPLYKLFVNPHSIWITLCKHGGRITGRISWICISDMLEKMNGFEQYSYEVG